MTDQRCPFCGKPNPAGAATCQYCQARLKPLVVSNPDEPQDLDSIFSQHNEPEESVPDWLKDLRGPEDEAASISAEEQEESEAPFDSPGAPEEPEQEGEPQDEMPDWLARIRERSVEEQPPAPEESQEAAPEPSLEEYLAQQEAQQASREGAEAAPPVVTDWLEAISRLHREQEVQPASDQLPEEENTPVEMSEPDWLRQARSQKAGEAVTEQPAAIDQPAVGEQPAITEQPGVTKQPAVEEQPEAVLPLAETQPAVEEQLPAEEAPAPEMVASEEMLLAEELPAKENIPAPEEAPEPASAAQEDLEDWLEEIGLASVSPAPACDQAAEEAPISIPEKEERQGELESKAEPTDESPDWMADWTGVFSSPAGQEGAEQSSQGTLASPGSEPDVFIPEWLLNLDAGTPPTPAESTPAFIFDDQDQAGLEIEPAAGSQVVPYTPPGSEAMPDWLAQASATPEEEAGEEAQEETPVEAGQLPGWLEAMRPVESVAPSLPGVEGAWIEKAGPLAGLKGTLSAGELVMPYSKPKLQSIRLQVSDAQQAHVTLLEQLLTTEGDAKPVAKRQATKGYALLRTLIFVVLLLALLTPMALNTSPIDTPSLPADATDVREAYRLVNSLAANDPVLLAFDYQPGLSGEMDELTQMVIGQMEIRKAHLVAISSTPVGPLMAERLIARNTGSPAAAYYQSYTNLGFIPGGTSGLAGLAADPRQAVPYDMKGQPAWGIGPLAPVAALKDFRMVVVFTESPDTARTWIEQVGPALGEKGTPLMMVVSAQAEPLVRPYFESSPRQVSALIAGLRGGAFYEKLSQQPGPVSRLWGSYGLGLLAAAAMIFLGGLVSLVIGLVTAGKRVEAEAKV